MTQAKKDKFRKAVIKRYSVVYLVILSFIIGVNFKNIEAKISAQLPQASTALIFTDNFDRPDSSILGNGWLEVEASGAQLGVQNSQLCFLDTSDVVNRPIAQVDFQQVNSGEFVWNYQFDWTRITYEGTYRVFMQLGDQTLLSSDDQNFGVAVNLVWTRIDNVHQVLGYRKAGVDYALAVVSGLTDISVLVDLDTQVYQVALDGEIIQSEIPFDTPVAINSLRYFSDVLNDIYFSGRCFDNVSIESVNVATPTATLESTPSPTPTDPIIPTSTSTPSPTLTATITETPTITSTPTEIPSTTVTPTSTLTSTISASPTSTPTQISHVYKNQSFEIEVIGPDSTGMGAPNPFLVEVNFTFTGPNNQTYIVPGFYNGDGVGGLDGNIWIVRFTPDEVGVWTFVSGSNESMLDGVTGSFNVIDNNFCQPYLAGGLPDFECTGRLEYSGDHYLRFLDGTYWLKGGEDDPEDFLAPGVNAGFASKFEAVDYLASKGVNSLYIMMNNIGGDGNNVWPWVGDTPAEAQSNTQRFDTQKLAEWEQLFDYLETKGIVLHLVFEDDSGWTGFNREIYYRYMVANFAHHNGLIWNISEEYNENYSADQVKSFAQIVRDLDPYNHPITVHHFGSLDTWLNFLGDDRFDLTSFQTDKSPANPEAVSWFDRVESSGRTIPVSFDETGQIGPSDRDLARHIVWSVYMGGANYELHSIPLNTYVDFSEHMSDMTRARQFIEKIPYWNMRPMNELILSGNAYLFTIPNEIFSAYLPAGGPVELDLSSTVALFNAEWFNPRNGSTLPIGTVQGGSSTQFEAPSGDDWVLILSISSNPPTATSTPTATPTPTATTPSTPTATMTATIPSILETVEVRVSASTDDAEENETGWMYITSSDLELVYSGGNQEVGMRFNGVGIPRGATITRAYVQFKVDETDTETTDLVIEAEAVDNAPGFVDQDGDISRRARTAARVNWTPVPWLVVGEAGIDQRTPDIALLIEEVVKRSGWESGNSIVLIVTGGGVRTAESYNGDPSGAPLLHIEYTQGGVVTATSTPTATWTPTATSTVTPTPVGTQTPTPTPTPTATTSSTPTPIPTISPTSSVLLVDNFDRPNSNFVNQGWIEVEGSGTQIGIQGNQLCFLDTSDASNLPIIQQSFAQVESGTLIWEFDFDWQRIGNEGRYSLFMQLGDSALMANNDQDAGIGVNLQWTRSGGTNEVLVYRQSGTLVNLGVVSGFSKIKIEADLDADLFDIFLDNVLLQTGLPFDNQVNLNTVRYFTDVLNEVNFSGRCFDNLSIISGNYAGSQPSFTSIPVTQTGLWQSYSYDADAVGDPSPVYSLIDAPLGMKINAGSGLISWTPGLVGNVTVSVQAANSSGIEVQTFGIDVSAEPQFTCSIPIGIMPLGDSITVGKSSGVDDLTQQISYRLDLWNQLSAAGHSVNFIGSQTNGEFYLGFDPQHEGHGGWTDSQIAANIYDNGGENWLIQFNPSVVLLHIGTNSLNSDPSDVERILNEIDQYELIEGSQVVVVIARIINQVPHNSTVTQFNDNVMDMVQARIETGDRIVMVDMEDSAGLIYSLQPAGDMWDSLHPYASGYSKMADEWFQSLTSILPVCP